LEFIELTLIILTFWNFSIQTVFKISLCQIQRKRRQSLKKKKKPAIKSISKKSLVASPSVASAPADIDIVFSSGLGQATAVLFRNGVLINMQSISTSGTIHFTDVQSRDSISVNGVCTGSADITVSVPTNPPTPEHFTAGIIMTGYTVR
jgi:hypothetical protein